MGDVTPKNTEDYDALTKYQTGTDNVMLAADGAALFVHGITLPTDGDSGYAIGCLFLHTDGTDGSALYVNEGTSASADFNLIVVT